MIGILLLALAAAPQSLTSVRDSYPHLSPDGRALLFHSDRSGKQAIWIAAGDGSGPRMLFDGGRAGTDAGTPVWSPDGRLIAFAMRPAGATDENESDVYLMKADGSDVRRLTHAPGDDSHPHWSTDGKRIFFNSARATPDLGADWARQWIDIYSMAVDGSDIRRHTDCRTVCSYPSPSPNGQWIVYRMIVTAPGLDWSNKQIARNSEVFVTAVSGGKSVNLSDSTAFDGWPTWSPDGRWVLFTSNRDQLPNVGQVYAIRPDGTGLKRLTEGLSKVQPSLSSDGKRLYFYENVETDQFEIGHIGSLPISLGD